MSATRTMRRLRLSDNAKVHLGVVGLMLLTLLSQMCRPGL